jgi:hypothetical protein
MADPGRERVSVAYASGLEMWEGHRLDKSIPRTLHPAADLRMLLSF